MMGSLLIGAGEQMSVIPGCRVDITHSDICNPSRLATATPGSLLGDPDMLAPAGGSRRVLQHERKKERASRSVERE